jgi:hypothetical protein
MTGSGIFLHSSNDVCQVCQDCTMALLRFAAAPSQLPASLLSDEELLFSTNILHAVKSPTVVVSVGLHFVVEPSQRPSKIKGQTLLFCLGIPQRLLVVPRL